MNPMGDVPVLEVDGQRMSQSGAVLMWLADSTGKFAPRIADLFEAWRWILFDNHKFTNNYAMHRFQHYSESRIMPSDSSMAVIDQRFHPNLLGIILALRSAAHQR
jgi:glutathione S-transferase